MTEYYATCDVRGPISVKIIAHSIEGVLKQIIAKGGRWIDDYCTDAENDFIDANWNNYSPEDIQKVMQDMGYRCVNDSGLKGYWVVWTK